MDGVLADSEPLHQHAIRLLLAEYGVDWMPDGRDPTVGLTSLESFAIICERHALRHDPRHLDALYTARVLPLLRERVTPPPGVPDVPRALAARGLRLARAAGMRCVAIPCNETRHHDFRDATLVLPALPDLLTCLLFTER